MNYGDKVSFIWSVADLLCGPYKPAQNGRVILTLTVLRRLDCVLEPTKEKVLAKAAELKDGKVSNADPILSRIAKASFHNTSDWDGSQHDFVTFECCLVVLVRTMALIIVNSFWATALSATFADLPFSLRFRKSGEPFEQPA